jgi:predicted metal-dependent hydrolase
VTSPVIPVVPLEARHVAPPTVTPRDLHFDVAGAQRRAWLGGDPVGTAVFNALSLTFPLGERMFMDAVRQHRHLLSGQLRDEASAFLTQEAVHSREHIGLNALIDRDHYPVDAMEARLRQRLTKIRDRGPMAMLLVTIALEHFTALMADWFLEDTRLLSGAPAPIARLWQWHAMEETEHKAVAFDVFVAVTADWTPAHRRKVRNRAMAIVTVLFISHITWGAAKLLAADGVGPAVARIRVLWFLFGTPGLLRGSWAAYTAWYKADFHPWNQDNRKLLERWRTAFALPEPQPRAA